MTDHDDNVRMLVAIAAGSRADFADFYRTNCDMVFAILLRMLRDRTDAEDLLQEVFVRVWTRAGRYDPRLSNPRTWLVAITRNAAIDRLRSRQVRPVTQPVDPGLPGPGPGPEAQAIAADQRTRLDGCLDELDADKAQAVRRAYLDGWSYEELARDADVPLNTMKTWLRRSLQRLRACMEYSYSEAAPMSSASAPMQARCRTALSVYVVSPSAPSSSSASSPACSTVSSS